MQQIFRGHIKRKGIITSFLRGSDCITTVDLPVGTTVYYTRELRNGRYYAVLVSVDKNDLS